MKDIDHVFIEEIPLQNLIYALDSRGYNRNLSIEYIKEIYNIDISDYNIKTYEFDNNIDIFEEFESDFPLKFNDNGTRDFFNNYMRKRYEKLYKRYITNDGLYDMAINFCTKADVIHHIYPLVYGGNNSLKNLIPLCDFNHKLLHMNPYENDRKHCYKTLDYLFYLWHGKLEEVGKKYDLKKYFNMNKRLLRKMTECAMENEMMEYYEGLEV